MKFHILVLLFNLILLNVKLKKIMPIKKCYIGGIHFSSYGSQDFQAQFSPVSFFFFFAHYVLFRQFCLLAYFFPPIKSHVLTGSMPIFWKSPTAWQEVVIEFQCGSGRHRKSLWVGGWAEKCEETAAALAIEQLVLRMFEWKKVSPLTVSAFWRM